MVGGLLPPPAVAMNARLGERTDQGWRHPDMIEAAAAIACCPVPRAIAPPSIKVLFRRHEMPDGVDEPAGLLQRREAVDLDRGVADHFKQLLVRPHIGL